MFQSFKELFGRSSKRERRRPVRRTQLQVEQLETRLVPSSFYVSPTGNDANAGTSASSPWQSITRADQATFHPGDQLLFQGGQTFDGTLKLGSNDGGNAADPVVVGSYGSGWATIKDGGAAVPTYAIHATGMTGLTVENLNLVGPGWNSSTVNSTGIQLDNSNAVTINNVNASQFTWAGIQYVASNNLRIANVSADQNGSGIRGGQWGETATSNTNIYIGHCQADNNPGTGSQTNAGFGIFVADGTNVTLEYDEASNNGWNGVNGVGIIVAQTNYATIQYCIVHNQSSLPSGDGGGFDLDNGTTNSVMQYNLAYHNLDYGFYAFSSGNGAWSNNTYRYNIGINDYIASNMIWNHSYGEIAGSGPIAHMNVYDNVFYDTQNEPAFNWINSTLFNVWNNVFVGPNAASLPQSGSTDAGNDYWSLDGNPGSGGGLRVNPMFVNPSDANLPTNPTQLATATGFKLQSGSPLIGRGMDLRTTYGIDPGSHDFYGAPIPYGAENIGVDQSGGSTTQPPATPTGLTATAGNGQVSLSWNAAAGAGSYDIWRSTSSGGETLYKTGINGTSFTDTGLTNGTTYYYEVSAVNSAGQSGKSSQVSATPTQPVSGNLLSGAFNREGIVTNGTTFTSGFDGDGYALSANLLGASVNWNNQTFPLGSANSKNVVNAAGQTISLPAGNYSTLSFVAAAVNGNQTSQMFTAHYSDGTTQTFTQSFSDWYTPQGYSGEAKAATMAYRDTSSGGTDNRTFYLYGYQFALNGSKTVTSITLPNNSNVELVSAALTPAATANSSVNLSGSFNRLGTVTDGTTISGGGIDGWGNALSANLLGSSLKWNNQTFNLGAANSNNAVSAAGQTINLPAGNYAALYLLALGVDGNQPNQTFVAHYTDGTSQTFTQSISDWATPQGYSGETKAASTAYRDTANGGTQSGTFNVYGYRFALNSSKTLQSITLPNDSNVEVLAMNLGTT